VIGILVLNLKKSNLKLHQFAVIMREWRIGLYLFHVLAAWFAFRGRSILNLIYELLYVQEDVFQSVGVPLVRNALAGYNTTILSFGQVHTVAC